MRRRNLIIVVTALILGAMMAGVAYWRWVDSPRYALQRLALGLQSKNMAEVFKYLDIKSILNNFLEESSRELAEPKGGKDDELNRLGRRMGSKVARMFLPALFNNFEKEIKAALEKYLVNLDNTQILAIVAAATTAQIEVKEEQARVTLMDPKSKIPFRLQMQRQPESRTWQIVSINYQDLNELTKREFRGR